MKRNIKRLPPLVISSFKYLRHTSKVAPPQTSKDQKPHLSSISIIGSISSVRTLVANKDWMPSLKDTSVIRISLMNENYNILKWSKPVASRGLSSKYTPSPSSTKPIWVMLKKGLSLSIGCVKRSS